MSTVISKEEYRRQLQQFLISRTYAEHPAEVDWEWYSKIEEEFREKLKNEGVSILK